MTGAVDITVDTFGVLTVHFDAEPPARGCCPPDPGYFDVMSVMLGSHDIADELAARGLMAWVKQCAIEQLQEDAAA